jgi:hypothetical protein
MRLTASLRAPAYLAVLEFCLLLMLVTSNATAQLPAATYNGNVTSAVYPIDNPNCDSPPITCIHSQTLSAPGTVTVSSPGPVPNPTQVTFGTLGPSASASATVSSVNVGHSASNANAHLQYFVEIVGPAGNVPVFINATGGVSASNGFPIGNDVAEALLQVTQEVAGYSSFVVGCAVNPANESPSCPQQAFSGSAQLTVAANTPITVALTAFVSITSPYGVNTFTAFVDPVFSIDPAFPNAGAYTISVSPGITQSTGTGPGAPAMVGAASRKVHGSAGTFDLPLSAVATDPATEPRTGPSQTIVFTFDKPVNGATATITEGAAVAGGPTFSGNDVIVALTGVTDRQYVTVALTDVASIDGGTGGSGSVRIGFLLGDVNQNRVVTLADLGLVNAQLAQSVTAANYLKDVNASGTLTLADKGITNANLTKALPAP